ncbi:MAG: nicotinate (nicotinamide) nucleotide adenylyltransferase [Akkermansia sp.]|nr:nicotinate (nicotinamide) nucleotide adenylyltransferase [Akkermansia sp.]
MKICLFGGSFDPVHTGHLHIATKAQQQLELERVVFLPAARSPFKTSCSAMFSDAERLRILRAATADLPWAEVSDADLQLPAPSWSWRLVELWKTRHPHAELYWLLGTDQWEQLHRWARFDYLRENLSFIIYHRGDTSLPPRPGVRSTVLSGELHPASSAAIRQALREGSPLPEDWIPPGVQPLLQH